MRKTNSKKSKRIAKTGNRILSVVIRRIYDGSPDTSWLGEYSNTRESEFSIDRAHSEDCASVSLIAKQAKATLEHAQQTIGDLHNAVLAEYNGTLANEELDRERDALDEAYNLLGELSDEATECDCGEHGDMGRREYRYFNPGSVESFKADASWIPADVTDKRAYWETAMRSNAKQDYERMESLNRGNFCFIGIRAEAEIAVENAHATNLGDGVPYFDSTVQIITSGGLWGIESDSSKEYFAEIEQDELSDLRDQLIALGFSRRAISVAFKNVEHKEE